MIAQSHTRRRPVIFAMVVSAVLVALVWLVFGQTVRHSFSVLDDPAYVTANEHVNRGLSAESVRWAFTQVHAVNWHPLTWISHMVDCEWHGLHPGGHHLTNVLLHGIVAVLLFFALKRLSGDLSASAAVAVIFSIHPLRVESVAWVAERKDLLAGFWFMLLLLAYVRYTRKVSPGRYLWVAAALVCGLMSKPVLVSAPLVLLLLDYWPLNRLRDIRWSRLVLEKLPLLALSAGSCVATLLAQQEAIIPVERFSLVHRLCNASVSYATYVCQLAAPTGLAPYYPQMPEVSLWKVSGSVALLAGISAVAVWLRRRAPYLIVGWLWFILMLVPMIGIVQVGVQAHADRYTYLPHIGLIVVLVWGVGDVLRQTEKLRWVAGGVAMIAVVMLAWKAHGQAALWADGEILWKATIERTKNNAVAHELLARTYLDRGQPDKAYNHSTEATRILPRFVKAYNTAGESLVQMGRAPEAAALFQRALELAPRSGLYLGNLGAALLEMGQIDRALAMCQKAAELDPGGAHVQNNLGHALMRSGRVEEGITHCQRAVELMPDLAGAHNNLAIGWMRLDRPTEALAAYNRALELDSKSIGTLNNLAALLATSADDSVRDPARALMLARTAADLAPGNPAVLNTLAAAYAATGDYDQAVLLARDAMGRARQQGAAPLAAFIGERIESYEARRPIRE